MADAGIAESLFAEGLAVISGDERVGEDEAAGAAIVPRNFWDVGFRGRVRFRIVCGGPIARERNLADVGVVLRHEIGAADIHGVGGGGVVTGIDAEDGVFGLFGGGALVGAGVALRDEEGGAFGGGELRFEILERDFGLAGDGFAEAVAEETMSGGLGCSRMPSVARSRPETVFVLSQAARTMLASGADAVDHSTSRAASSSSLLAPGFLQLG